jgi:hypothetical protein
MSILLLDAAMRGLNSLKSQERGQCEQKTNSAPVLYSAVA